MIPYDDLVAALTAWRARQGLPVAQSAAPPAPPPKKTAPAAAVAASGRPAAARTAAPAADLGDFEDSALVEDSYDSGEDYVVPLGVEQTAEPTAIGNAPEPTPARGKRDKW